MRTNSKAHRENVLKMIISGSGVKVAADGAVMEMLRKAYDAGSSAAKDERREERMAEIGADPDGSMTRGM